MLHAHSEEAWRNVAGKKTKPTEVTFAETIHDLTLHEQRSFHMADLLKTGLDFIYEIDLKVTHGKHKLCAVYLDRLKWISCVHY